jgi:hypothetical protein
MIKRNLVPLLAVGMMVTFSVVSAAASINLNSSKSNVYKTAADCSKAGGEWGKGRQGVGCYFPPTAKPTPGSKAVPKQSG